jgi:hypothetical protein
VVGLLATFACAAAGGGCEAAVAAAPPPPHPTTARAVSGATVALASEMIDLLRFMSLLGL